MRPPAGAGSDSSGTIGVSGNHGLFLLALVEIVWSAKDELFSKAYTHIDCRKAQWLFLLVFPWFCCHCRCLQCSWSWSCRLPCAFPELTAVCLSRTHGRWLYWTEESTSRYQTHTWRGGMRRRPVQPTHAHYVRVPEGYDGLMLHRGSNDPARGGVATSGSLHDHKSGNWPWWSTWWVSVGRAAAHVEKSVVMKQHVQFCIIPSGNMGSIKYGTIHVAPATQGLACCWRRWRLWWWGQLVGVLPKQGPTGDKLPGPRSHGLPGRTAQQIPGAVEVQLKRSKGLLTSLADVFMNHCDFNRLCATFRADSGTVTCTWCFRHCDL